MFWGSYRVTQKKGSLAICALLEAPGWSIGLNISRKHFQTSFSWLNTVFWHGRNCVTVVFVVSLGLGVMAFNSPSPLPLRIQNSVKQSASHLNKIWENMSLLNLNQLWGYKNQLWSLTFSTLHLQCFSRASAAGRLAAQLIDVLRPCICFSISGSIEYLMMLGYQPGKDVWLCFWLIFNPVDHPRVSRRVH